MYILGAAGCTLGGPRQPGGKQACHLSVVSIWTSKLMETGSVEQNKDIITECKNLNPEKSC